MQLLVIGGTRNLGPGVVTAALERGASVTVLNRGVTPDDLPAGVERLRADRTDEAALAAALAGREWDAVVDFACYTGAEAAAAARVLGGRTAHYVFISSGQVYLVRDGASRPFREPDYAGPLLPPPAAPADRAQWQYGIDKRDAEDALARAWDEARFPYTSLRLPMVHSERDHYGRIAGYLARLADGGPILVPDRPHLPVRHVYGGDVVQAVLRLLEGYRPCGEAFNIGQDEAMPFEAMLDLLARTAGRELRIARVAEATLEQENLLPQCSPFSGRWMSELDNSHARHVFWLRATPVELWVPRLVAWHAAHPTPPAGYATRPRELELAAGR